MEKSLNISRLFNVANKWRTGKPLGTIKIDAPRLKMPKLQHADIRNYGVDKGGANRSGIFIHLMPVFSIILAILFLGERMRGL